MTAVAPPANDMTDRQWVAAWVIDNAPWMFAPLVEVRAVRDRLAVEVARGVVECEAVDTIRFAAADALAGELEACATVIDQHALLAAVARGEA